MKSCAVLLAGGSGTRWRGTNHKLLAEFRGKPVLQWSIENAIGSGLEVFVVYGAIDLSAFITEHKARPVLNSRWQEGQATSLVLATDVAAKEGFDSIVVGLGDQPLILPSTWASVAGVDETHAIVVAAYEGVKGHPVRLNASIWERLDRMGDSGARTLMTRNPEFVWELACEGSTADIDTLEDLQRWS